MTLPHIGDREMGLAFPRRFWATACLLVTLATIVSGSTSVNIALPSIAADLAITPGEVVWVVNAYQLGAIVALLPAAALGEMIGYRVVFRIGLSVFVLGAFLCSLSGSLPALAAARALQGLGSAGVLGVMGAMVRHTYPRSWLGRGLGLNSLTASIATASGPLIGSALLSFVEWPWVFAVNLPLGILALSLTAALPHSTKFPARFNWQGAALNAVTFGALILGVGHLNTVPLLGLAEITLALISGTILLRHELSITRPLIPLDLLAMPSLASAAGVSMFCFAAQLAALASLPFYFAELGVTRQEIAFLLTLCPCCIAPAAVLAGRLSDTCRPDLLCLLGTAVFGLGLGSLLLVHSQSQMLALVAAMAVAGLGFGFFQTPNNRILVTSAPIERSGGASGLQAMARECGFALGASLLGLAFAMSPQHPAAAGVGVSVALTVGATALGLARCFPPRS
ncbi:MFS transporter [Devosia sp. 1635]|uniref:MFS transporter n=1 Tax=Devosia sp. 1635 TaxID=2726066 RepID=UPI001567353D|nr:MFS transporter [Devosia sp. 1635]